MDKMTVDDLREALRGIDGDTEIHIHASGAFKNLRRVDEEEIRWNTGEYETVVSLR